MKKKKMRYLLYLLCLWLVGISLGGCKAVDSGRRIVRIAHGQSETHPEHIGLLALEQYIEERLGDRFDIQIFPNEILWCPGRQIWRPLRASMRSFRCPIYFPPRRRIMPRWRIVTL